MCKSTAYFWSCGCWDKTDFHYCDLTSRRLDDAPPNGCTCISKGISMCPNWQIWNDEEREGGKVVSEKDCTYCLANPERKRKVEGKWHVPQWAEEGAGVGWRGRGVRTLRRGWRREARGQKRERMAHDSPRIVLKRVDLGCFSCVMGSWLVIPSCMRLLRFGIITSYPLVNKHRP